MEAYMPLMYGVIYVVMGLAVSALAKERLKKISRRSFWAVDVVMVVFWPLIVIISIIRIILQR